MPKALFLSFSCICLFCRAAASNSFFLAAALFRFDCALSVALSGCWLGGCVEGRASPATVFVLCRVFCAVGYMAGIWPVGTAHPIGTNWRLLFIVSLVLVGNPISVRGAANAVHFLLKSAPDAV